jgi:hypothetical protein
VTVVLSAVPFGHRQARTRFRALAQVRSAIDHPGLLPVHGFGEYDGAPFVVTDPYPSATLADRLTEGAIPADEALPMLASAAEALDVCNALGLVHPSLCDESLLLDGERFVLDTFEVASASPGRLLGRIVLRDIRYAPPELLHGDALEPASNVYSLAALLVHALTGRLPYEGPRSSVRQAHETAPPPCPSERLAHLAPLDKVIVWGMAKSPSRRPESAATLVYHAADVLRVAMPRSRERPSAVAAPILETPDRQVERRVRRRPSRDRVIAWAKAKSPSRRLKSPAALVKQAADALGGAVHRSRERLGAVAVRIPAMPRKRKAGSARRRPSPAVAATLGVVCAAVAGGFFAGRAADPLGDGSTTRLAAAPDVRLISRLDERRAQLRAELTRAPGPQEQSAAAAELASTYGEAAGGATAPSLGAAAQEAESAYTELASAAEVASDARFADAAAEVERAERGFAATVARIANLQDERK